MLKENEVKSVVEDVVKWVKDYVEKAGAKGVVIGNSGGKDSATVISIATKALGKERVLAIGMPCSSITNDLEDAKLIAKTFGIKMITVDLSETYDILENKINSALDIKISTDSKINMKPRLRMVTLYSVAQELNYLVIGTGNASEGYVGYTTKWGDSAYDFNPIANFTVEEVRQIGKYLGVPESIIYKAPNDGLGTGTDEQKMGILYSQISEFMETGKTEKTAMERIKLLHEKSEHKRAKVPTFERK